MGDVYVAIGGGGGASSDDVTATRDKVLAGYTALTADSNDEPVNGSMVNQGAWNGSAGMNSQITVPAGYHNGSGRVSGPSITDRGAWGTTLGINGNVTIPQGYHNGSGRVTQNLPVQNAEEADRAWATSVGGWEGRMCLGVRNGYYLNGVNWIQASIPGLAAGNIRQGVVIGPVTGTMPDYSYLAAGQVSF